MCVCACVNILARSKEPRPGPASYSSINTIKDNGSYFISKFRSSGSRTFGKDFRRPVGGQMKILSK